MSLLAGKAFPETREALRAAILEPMRGPFCFPAVPPEQILEIAGPDLRHLDRLKLDFTGAIFDPTRLAPKPEPHGERHPGIVAAHFEVAGHPVRIQSAPLDVSLTASEAQFDFGRDRENRPLLVLAGASEGRITVGATRSALEDLLLAGARDAAQKQGILIERTSLSLSASGTRSVRLELTAQGSKGMFSATVRVRGRLDVDDKLNLRLSGLGCEGDGLIGSLVSSFLSGHLRRFEDHRIPLAAFGPGDLRLRDIRVDVRDGLRLDATFQE